MASADSLSSGDVLDAGSESGFDSLLKKSGGRLVVVDFFADWCGPCKMMAPHFKALAQTHKGKAVFIKVDVDGTKEVSQRYGVSGLPTFILLLSGKEVGRVTGANKSGLESQIIQHLGSATTTGGDTFSGKGQSLQGATSNTCASMFNFSRVTDSIRENPMPWILFISIVVYYFYQKSG